MTGKLKDRRVNIVCLQKTKLVGKKAKEAECTDFKLWYTGCVMNNNGVDIMIDKILKDRFVDTKRKRSNCMNQVVVRDVSLNFF